ncbi:MAG: nicotinate (nicotinamide) nucleotide adenylyltransferase [Bacteroidota bacterium]
MKIGLFFGSFNPVHIGHLVIAQAAVNETELDRVWMVVTPQNPFKKKTSLLGEYDRYRMVELALEGNLAIEASNVEFALPKPSYTIDTLNHLNRKYASYEFALIMGEDNLAHLHKWKDATRVLQYPIYCYPRLGGETDHFARYPDIVRFEMPYLDISATRIRNMIKEGKSVQYLVPGAAFSYLEDNALYRT